MNIEHETVARWFNYVRENTLNIKRFTECFWDTQLKSKAEIIDNLPQDLHGNYYVFGGWYGVLAGASRIFGLGGKQLHSSL